MNETTFDSNGNIVEQTIDNGNGKGVRTTFDADGNVTATEEVTGLPIVADPDPVPEPDSDAATFLAAEQARRTAFDAYLASHTLSNAALREATRAGSDAYLDVICT